MVVSTSGQRVGFSYIVSQSPDQRAKVEICPIAVLVDLHSGFVYFEQKASSMLCKKFRDTI